MKVKQTPIAAAVSLTLLAASFAQAQPVSYTHLTLPTNREV